VTSADVGSLVLVLAASTAGAILSRVHHRLVLPTVVVEIVLGILIGSEVLDIAKPDAYIEFLANIGLVFLFFFAGLEVIEKHVQRRSLALGTGGWVISLAVGLTVGLLLDSTRSASSRPSGRCVTSSTVLPRVAEKTSRTSSSAVSASR
jgi:Kef-type K+ transport system membrane component KefB